MKRFILLSVVLFAIQSRAQVNSHHVFVNTENGGYYRTAPNSTLNDNFSTVGNINPYTGEAGNIDREPVNNAYHIPDLADYPTYNRMDPVIASEIPSRLGDGEIELAKDVHYKEPHIQKSAKHEDVSKPMTGSATSQSLWNIDEKPKPSFETYHTGTPPKQENNSDEKILFWAIGVCVIGIISLNLKSKA